MHVLVTGAPGSGKTLWTLSQIIKEEGRPVYYYGIPGLDPELGWYEIQNPEMWHEEVPDAAIVIIDEVQQVFGTRSPKAPIPPGISCLETHRHRGLDVYFITQFPTMYDHHGRRLVGRHVHLIRRKGASFASLYDSDTVITDPNDRKQLRGLEKKQFKFPKEVFKLYKSAEIHTHKFRPPKKLYVLLVLLLLFIGGVYWGYLFFTRDFGKDPEQQQRASGEQGEAAPRALPPLDDLARERAILTLDSFKPAVPDIPATAPIYSDALKVQSVPFVTGCYQVIVADHEICRCHSDQGAILPVSVDFCRHFVRYGYHNFLKKADARF